MYDIYFIMCFKLCFPQTLILRDCFHHLPHAGLCVLPEKFVYVVGVGNPPVILVVEMVSHLD